MSTKPLYVLLIILLLCGCGSRSHDTKNNAGYTIATLKGPSSMGMIKLIDSLNSNTGTNIHVEILDEPIQVRKMMIDGTADFSILPTTMASIVYNKGMPYQLIGIPLWGSLYLTGSDTGITHWEQLRGKRVYVMARGMTPDVLFRYLLQKNGLNPDTDLTLDYSFPTHIDLANAVAAGQAGIGVLSEPMASMVMKSNKHVHQIFDLNEEWKKCEGVSIAITAFMVKKSLALSNKKIVENVISGYQASTRWVNENRDSAAALIVKYNILPDYNVAFDAIPRSNLKFVRAKDIKMLIDEYLNVFYKINPDIIGGKLPDEGFIYR